MPLPRRCPNPSCVNHHDPPAGWWRPFGSYPTIAHGQIPRFCCRSCATTCSTQTESMHYFAKRHLPLKAIVASLLEGASMREIARRYRVSPMTIQSAIIRLGRQALATHTVLMQEITPRPRLVFDGLRSFVTSQDYPCDLTTLVDAESEAILSITHAIFHRAGTMTRAQRRRVDAKRDLWQIPAGTMIRSISLVWDELWHYLRRHPSETSIIDTDRHRDYRALARRSLVMRYMTSTGLARYRTTSSLAARNAANPLFPVNYVDRLIRHRLREHTRETLAFGRHSAMQMFRMWLFAWDHNTRRPWRERTPQEGVHAGHGAWDEAGMAKLKRVNREFFRRRIDVRGCVLPESIVIAWRAEAVTPPVRWRTGQKGTTVLTPAYARRDLARSATRFWI